MLTILIILQVLIALSLIALILVQHGKGADMGAAFGSGASGTVFGSRGSSSFLTKATTYLGVLFFVNCLAMATPAVNGRGKSKAPASVAERIAPVEAPTPAVDTDQTQKALDLPDLPGEEQVPAK